MRDQARRAAAAGLRPVTAQTCLACHANAHGKPFDFATALAKIAHPTRPEAATAAVGKRTALAAHGVADLDDAVRHGRLEGARWPSSTSSRSQYKNPVNLAFRPDGREVWVACEASGTVVVVDAAQRVKVAEIPVGGQATDLAFSPDGTRAYVTQPPGRHRGR